MTRPAPTTTRLSLIAALMLAACGSGSSSSPDSAAQLRTTRGAITAKANGSMTVNGVELSTTSAAIRFDDAAGLDEWLRKGMVVTVKGHFDDRGGEATEVEFEHGIEGPVTEIGEDWIVVGGQRVHVDDSTEFGDDRLNRLAGVFVNDTLQITGVPDDRGGLRASRIDDSPRDDNGDLSDDDDLDIKGFVSVYTPGVSFQLRLSPDAASHFVVDVSGLAAVPAGLKNGAYVEVHTRSLPTGTPPVIVASAIEIEDRFDESEVEIEVEGIVSSIITGGATPSFMVDGVTVVTDGSTRWELGTPADLTLGVKVEAEGSMDSSGVLHAEKVAFKPGARITAVIENYDGAAGTMTLLGIHVQVPSFARVDSSLQPLGNGKKIEVRGNPSANGTGVVAYRVEPPSGNDQRVFIRAVATAKASANPAQPTFTVLGFNVTTAGAEFRGLSEEIMTPQAFFAAVETGRTVIKVRADSVADVNAGAKTWAADEIELEGND